MNEKELLKHFIACTFKNVFGSFGGLTKPFTLQGGWVVVLGGCGELCKHCGRAWGF